MSEGSEKSPRSRRPLQFFLGAICVGLAAFWVYALFFASKQGVNVLEDKAWTVRAEEICKNANLERDKLIDLRRIDSVDGNALSQRADIIDKATVIIQQMLKDVTATLPAGVVDVALIHKWQSIYTSWINARIDYTAVLRTGENAPFAESMLYGSPESDFINDFTTNNRMTSCAAPMDLAV